MSAKRPMVSLCEKFGHEKITDKRKFVLGEIVVDEIDIEGEVMLRADIPERFSLMARLDMLKDVIGLL